MVNDRCGVKDAAIADNDRNETNRIEVDRAFRLCRTKKPESETNADQPNRDIDEKDPPPEVSVREQSAEYRAGSGSSYHDHAINAEGPSLFVVFKGREKHHGAQRQRDTAANSLQSTCTDEQPESRRKTRHQRSEEKDAEAQDVNALEVETVGENPCERCCNT